MYLFWLFIQRKCNINIYKFYSYGIVRSNPDSGTKVNHFPSYHVVKGIGRLAENIKIHTVFTSTRDSGDWLFQPSSRCISSQEFPALH